MTNIDEQIELSVKAMQAASLAAKGKPLPFVGMIECPKCKGVLRFSIRGPRAHRGQCETEGCLSWVG